MKNLIFFLLLIVCTTSAKTQCINTFQFPFSIINASTFNDVQLISDINYAGDYFIIQGLTVGGTYEFTSSNAGDYITVRDKDGLALLGSGNTPLTYVVT